MSPIAQPEMSPELIITNWFKLHEPGTANPAAIEALHHLYEPILAIGIALLGPERFMDNEDPLQTILTTKFPTHWESGQHAWLPTATLAEIHPRYTMLDDQLTASTERGIMVTLSEELREVNEPELLRISGSRIPFT